MPPFLPQTIAALVSLLALSAGSLAFAQTTLTFEQFKAVAHPSDAVLYDRHGAAIGSKRIDLTVRRLDWTALNDVSPALIEALLMAEDQRFYQHSGVDWQGVAAALWNNIGDAKTRGASSIPMQVAAFLNPDLARGTAGRSVSQKWSQIQAARDLEKKWQKNQILEAYLNTVFFRGELQGLAAASWGLFNVAPSGLDKAQAALLAALIRAPNAKAALVAQRACVILSRTRAGQPCDATGLQAALSNATLRPQPVASAAPHLAQQLLDADATRFKSSLDAVLQRQVQALLTAQVAQIFAQGGQDGAAVVLDNATGEVLAYVGSSGASFSAAASVDGASSARQAGSTLKPFLFALAIGQQRLTAASLLADAPLSIATDAGLYTPHNYDERFIGDVSVRKALASSLNIPAVRAFTLLKPEALHGFLKTAGITSLNAQASHYGPSLALGSADVKLIELTNAYRALANGGLYSPWRLTVAANPVATVRVLPSTAAWVVGNILADNTARAHTFGFDSVLATPFWTAVKTGTSKDMRDNWCIGFSQRYTVGVWVGQAAGQSMKNVSGTAGAAPAWADIMGYLHRQTLSRPPTAPSGVSATPIRYEPELEPARTEWFVVGTSPATKQDGEAVFAMRAKQSTVGVKIEYPQPGSLMAWDPDIPASMQGMVLKHSGDLASLTWQLNGRALPGNHLLWQRDGARAKNTLELFNAAGERIDSVQFELRGLPKTVPSGRTQPP